MGPQESQDSQTAPQQPQQLAQPMAPPQPPQQFVQPAAFPQQVQPVTAQPGVLPMPAPKKGLSKGALWGIIGGGVGLLVIIIGVILGVVLLGGPSKDDYQKANNILNDAKTAYNGISGLSYISSYSATDTTIKNDQSLSRSFSLSIAS